MKHAMISELKHGLFKYDVKDYYAILGVPIDADAKQVRSRYLKIAYLFHPDTCQLETQTQKQHASEILSKLVNSAYENLYRDRLRRECQLIISEMGRRLANDTSKITIASESAKKLYQEEENLKQAYHQLIAQLAEEQYQDLNLITGKINLMSELNMVYLALTKEAELQSLLGKKPKPRATQSQPVVNQPPEQPSTATTEGISPETKEVPISSPSSRVSTSSRVSILIDSAREHRENYNLEQGILDMREALKIDPNNSTCHALLGSLYQKQGNIPMAKVHIKKAMQINRRDPELDPENKIVKQIKKELTGKATREKSPRGKDKKASAKSKEKKGPKIFGIPLW